MIDFKHEVDGKMKFDVAGRQVPDWLASASRSGNAITLSFMDPTELGNPDHGVPNANLPSSEPHACGSEPPSLKAPRA